MTVYQLATSVTNPCDMGRSIELTSLAHRKHYRAQEGLESWLRLRFDAIPVSKTRYNRMSAPAQKAIVKSIQRIMSPLPLKKAPLAKTERSLERLEKLIELFEPFILLNEHDFAAENIEKLSHALVPEERVFLVTTRARSTGGSIGSTFTFRRCAAGRIRLIEGRPLEARPARNFQLAPANGKRRREDRDGRSHVAIFLTGSTGYIGAHVAANLLEGMAQP
jgi:hypothetical protein